MRSPALFVFMVLKLQALFFVDFLLLDDYLYRQTNNMVPIGVFDSGYGGLTVLRDITDQLPRYDYLYLGDNARTPYGSRSFETVYHYTRQCVKWMFDQGCRLVIIACNTASARALRTIQQTDLVNWDGGRRVLGVIRPTAEVIGNYSKSRHVGILATKGTVSSLSYPLEIEKFFPDITISQHACPLWVPIIENDQINTAGAAYFFRKDIEALIDSDPSIDTVLLGCTHYPLAAGLIRKFLPDTIRLISQGPVTAASLKDYLLRHPELEGQCSRGGHIRYFTTDSTADFNIHSGLFLGERVESEHVDLG